MVAHLDLEKVHAESVPATAASAVYPLIAGPMTTGVVLGAFSQAVIVGLETVEPETLRGPWAVSLLGPLAAGVPNGVRFSAGLPGLGAHRPGDRVRIGGGGVVFGEVRFPVVRQWSSRVFRIDPDPAAVAVVVNAAAESNRGVPVPAIGELECCLVGGEVAAAVRALVGLGSGLTPGGDDVLAGLLTGLHATEQTDLTRLIGRHTLDGILDRTTVLSADLLRLAVAGHACVEALDVLRALHTGHQVPAALHRLLSIGHTSGADLATGLGIGLGMGLRCVRNMSRYGEGPTTIR